MSVRLTAAALAATLLFGGSFAAQADTLTAPMKSLSYESTGASVGKIVASETAGGIRIRIDLASMVLGTNWLLLGEPGNCPTTSGAIEGRNLGLISSGASFPGPLAQGESFLAPDLKLADLRDHALIVMQGDAHPGTQRISTERDFQLACGVAK